MSAFVDTSAWFAAVNRKDRNHVRAAELVRQHGNLVTSEHVFVETWLLLKNRMDFHIARSFWLGVRAGLVRVEPVTDVDLDMAWAIGKQYSDQSFSLIDLTSFVLCERLRIKQVISFDNDFVVYRFGSNRDQAFEVLR